MENNRKFYHLNEIFQEYKYVFPDTNAFLEFGTYFDQKGLFNKISQEERRIALFDFWKENFSKYEGFFITKKVFEELKEGSYNYNKASKRTSANKFVVKLRRVKRDSNKKRNEFLNVLNSNNLYVLEKDSEEEVLYNELSSKYDYFNRGLDKIHPADFDLLITGGVFSKLKGKTAIISNDSPMRRIWSRFIKNENINPYNLGFYFQKGLGSFEKGFFNR